MTKRWAVRWLAVFAVAVGGLAPGPAAAVDVHISSTTIGQGYQLITSSGDVLKRSRLNQFLGLDVLDWTGDKTNLLSFVSSFRFDSDFGITDAEADNIEQLKNNNLSILYAYFQVKGLADLMDIRLGRQLLIDDMDFTMLDGLRLVFHTPAHLGIEVYTGVEAKNAGLLGVITSTQLELDGDGGNDDDIDDSVGIVVGAAIMLENLRAHHGKIGYRRIMTSDGDVVDAERVFLNYHVRALPQLHLNAAVAWDFVINDMTDIRFGVRSPRIANLLDIEVNYFRLVPSFEGSSIFNIFSTEPINDIDYRLRFHIARGISVYAGGYVRLFGNETDSDDELDEDVIKDIGARAGGRVRLAANAHLGLDAIYQTGYSDMLVIDVFGGYGFLDNTLVLDGRLTSVTFEDDLQKRLEATSFGVQVGLTYKIPRLAKFHMISELNTNKLESVQFRMFGLVELDFWL